AAMSASEAAHATSLLGTLEEISRHVFTRRRPGRNADQYRAPDPAAISERRLLGLPVAARPAAPGAFSNRRATAVRGRQGPDAAERRPGGPGRAAAPAAGHRRCDPAPAFQILSRGGRGSVSLVSRRADARSWIPGRHRGGTDDR